MGRKNQQSSIDRLPPPVRDALNAWLRDPAITQLEATDRTNILLEEIGHPERITKSSVNRYWSGMEEAGAKLRQSREVAQMWIGQLGAAPQGQVGNLVNELVRTLAFDVTLLLQRGEIDEENAPGIVKMLSNLALTQMRLEKAASENVKREGEIRKQAIEDAANDMATVAKEEGVSSKTIERIRREVLRMAGA
jgi:hypothetical protein